MARILLTRCMDMLTMLLGTSLAVTGAQVLNTFVAWAVMAWHRRTPASHSASKTGPKKNLVEEVPTLLFCREADAFETSVPAPGRPAARQKTASVYKARSTHAAPRTEYSHSHSV